MKMEPIRVFHFVIKHLKANFEVLKNIKVKNLPLKIKNVLKSNLKSLEKDCMENIKYNLFIFAMKNGEI